MASNGLVANPSKTAILFLNNKVIDDPIKIKIGTTAITQEKSAKLLGMSLDDSQCWNTHFDSILNMKFSSKKKLRL